ncbi:MAG: hypothetical protein Q8M77_13845 [Hydrogenophaga sp.]|uniref:hypothetical protein n=1 Tax=Hydrogenophaga sp. TaxID=1904254 RepID=UPI00272FCADB|nr:hypothetical protein [Hydrogenophaga sp.]MDP2015494.1 hypothetical protein [Hydrogenophaga sp.]MDP3252981.1 hypothetical protein [Hydrogenophaga sp.]
MHRRNTLFPELEECISAEAAVNLSTVYGSRTHNTYIPKTMNSEKARRIARTIGLPATEKLVKDFGGQALRVPTLNVFYEEVRDDYIRIQLRAGISSQDIAAELGLTVDRVRQIRRWVLGPRRDRYPQRLRISVPTARTAAVYRAVLPTSLAAVFSPANMTAEVAREALGYFALFGPVATRRVARRPARPVAAKLPRPARHPLDVWNPLIGLPITPL